MTAREPIAEERLDLIRAFDLDTLIPRSGVWRPATRQQAARWLAQVQPVIVELLDEIDDLDDEIEAGDAELSAVTAELAAAQATIRKLRAALGRHERRGASVVSTGSGAWKVKWREDGRQRSLTLPTRRDAEGYANELRRGSWLGGAR